MSTSSSTIYVEPWLRGTHGDVPAASRAVLHALELAFDDVTKWTDGLTDAETHAQPLGLPSVAFQLRHIAGSVDRILTYAEARQLTPEQLATQKAEHEGSETLAELLGAVDAALRNAAQRVLALATGDLEKATAIGRKQLPASVGGTLIHVADHTMRHVGQVITTAKILTSLRG